MLAVWRYLRDGVGRYAAGGLADGVASALVQGRRLDRESPSGLALAADRTIRDPDLRAPFHVSVQPPSPRGVSLTQQPAMLTAAMLGIIGSRQAAMETSGDNPAMPVTREPLGGRGYPRCW